MFHKMRREKAKTGEGTQFASGVTSTTVGDSSQRASRTWYRSCDELGCRCCCTACLCSTSAAHVTHCCAFDPGICTTPPPRCMCSDGGTRGLTPLLREPSTLARRREAVDAGWMADGDVPGSIRCSGRAMKPLDRTVVGYSAPWGWRWGLGSPAYPDTCHRPRLLGQLEICLYWDWELGDWTVR